MSEKKYRIIIAGGRDFNDYQLLERKMLFLLQNIDYKDVEVVSGKAKGADALGEVFARKFDIAIKSFPAEWDDVGREGAVVKYTKQGKPYDALAGHIRNEWMSLYGTHLVAFWDSKSSGTANMIALAEDNGLTVKIYKY